MYSKKSASRHDGIPVRITKNLFSHRKKCQFLDRHIVAKAFSIWPGVARNGWPGGRFLAGSRFQITHQVSALPGQYLMLPIDLVTNVVQQRISGAQAGNNTVLNRVMTDVWKTCQVRKDVSQKCYVVERRMVPICRKTIKQADQLAKILMLYQQLGNYLVHLILPSVVLRSDIPGNISRWQSVTPRSSIVVRATVVGNTLLSPDPFLSGRPGPRIPGGAG